MGVIFHLGRVCYLLGLLPCIVTKGKLVRIKKSFVLLEVEWDEDNVSFY